jgi:hypothetical protein
VGLVFGAQSLEKAQPRWQWFTVLPENMHEEQKRFLLAHAPVSLGDQGR